MQLIRFAVSTAVETTARVLNLAGSAIGTVGRLVQAPRPPGSPQPSDDAPDALRSAPEIPRPPSDEATPATADVIEGVESSALSDRRGRVIELPPTPLLDQEPHLRRSETHIAELAVSSAGDVIAEVDHLSTDELRQLMEYETSHRNRKTVLAAIEKALAPVP